MAYQLTCSETLVCFNDYEWRQGFQYLKYWVVHNVEMKIMMQDLLTEIITLTCKCMVDIQCIQIVLLSIKGGLWIDNV